MSSSADHRVKVFESFSSSRFLLDPLDLESYLGVSGLPVANAMPGLKRQTTLLDHDAQANINRTNKFLLARTVKPAFKK